MIEIGRVLQDYSIIFSIPGMGETAFYCANHRISCKCQQPPGWKIHRFFHWKMPFAVFRSGSGVSENFSEKAIFSATLGIPQWIFLCIFSELQSYDLRHVKTRAARSNFSE